MATIRNTPRRALSFDDLGQIMPEVQALLAGHRTVGRWSLGQICNHLAASFDGSIDGLDLTRHRFKRFFLAKTMLRWAYRHGIPAGYTVDPHLTPPDHVPIEEAVAELERAIARYLDHRGALRIHPLFGGMPRDEWDRLHRFHSAHHLSFVIPRGESGTS